MVLTNPGQRQGQRPMPGAEWTPPPAWDIRRRVRVCINSHAKPAKRRRGAWRGAACSCGPAQIAPCAGACGFSPHQWATRAQCGCMTPSCNPMSVSFAAPQKAAADATCLRPCDSAWGSPHAATAPSGLALALGVLPVDVVGHKAQRVLWPLLHQLLQRLHLRREVAGGGPGMRGAGWGAWASIYRAQCALQPMAHTSALIKTRSCRTHPVRSQAGVWPCQQPCTLASNPAPHQHWHDRLLEIWPNRELGWGRGLRWGGGGRGG